MEPSLQRIFAVDVSGSTSKERFYHEKVQEIIDKSFRPGDKIIIWSSQKKEVSLQKMRSINAKLTGAGGTNIVLISEALNEMKTVEHLIIFTDGRVKPTKVDICDEFNLQHNIKPEYVTVYIIGKMSDVNYTVCAPFIRQCPYVTYYVDPSTQRESKEIEVCDEDIECFEKLDSIHTFDEFIQMYDNIENVIISKTIAKTRDIKLMNKLIKMRNKISHNYSSKIIFNSNVLAEAARVHTQKDHLRAAALVNDLFDTYKTPPAEFSRKFNTIIQMANGGLRTSLDREGIKSARIRLAQVTQYIDPVAIKEIPQTKVSQCFECPVSYEEETDPCILVANPEFDLLMSLNKRELDCVSNNPLNAFQLPKLVDEIVAHIDHAVSLKSLREADSLGMPITKSPITRKSIVGALTLGASESHVKATDYTLSHLLSRGNVIGNMDMWFALIWILIKEGRIPFLEEIEPFVLEHLAFRLSHSIVPAAMTGILEFPQTRVPTEVACFACLTCIETSNAAAKAVFRFHLPHADQLVQISEAVGLFISDETKRHIEWTRALLMLNEYAKENRTTYKQDFRALVQASESITVPEGSYLARRMRATKFLIPIDGEPDSIKANSLLLKFPKEIRTVDRDVLYWLSQFVDPHVPSFEVDYIGHEFEPYRHTAEWAHYDGTEEEFAKVIPICPQTMRPYLRSNHRPYSEALKNIIGEHEQRDIISCSNEYGVLVGRMKGYPSPEELMLAIFLRVCGPGKHSVLPRAIRDFCEETVRDFNLVTEGISWSKFLKRFRDSASKSKRIELEKLS